MSEADETRNDLACRIASFLDLHHVMSLATIGPDGPYASNLFYARDALALIWVSDPASQHSIHIESRAQVAATIAFDYHDFVEIEGLQVLGRARRIADGAGRRRARDRLHARYPFLERTAGVLRSGLAASFFFDGSFLGWGREGGSSPVEEKQTTALKLKQSTSDRERKRVGMKGTPIVEPPAPPGSE